MRPGRDLRELVAEGVVSGLWLQAGAAARSDDALAARCRWASSAVLQDVELLTGAGPEESAGFLRRGALVVLLQSLRVDLTGGSR
jgi:hypothetical protein